MLSSIVADDILILEGFFKNQSFIIVMSGRALGIGRTYLLVNLFEKKQLAHNAIRHFYTLPHDSEGGGGGYYGFTLVVCPSVVCPSIFISRR